MMDPQIKAKLLTINQDFYREFSESFSTTRHQVQPGVNRLSLQMRSADAVLDVGCGNGTLARQLALLGFKGDYLGLDQSAGLLADARQLLQSPLNGTYHFQRVNLADPAWPSAIPQKHYAWLTAFAVLHHLPGDDLRLETARAFRHLIAPGGTLAVSVWQWHNSPRLRKRVLPWSTVELDTADLDEGDVLLDWRAENRPGLRYVHTFSADSLTVLAAQAGFEMIDSFLSDGKMGNLALYQTWRPEQESKKPAQKGELALV